MNKHKFAVLVSIGMVAVALAALLLSAANAIASPPAQASTTVEAPALSSPVLQYQGRLLNPSTGNPKPNGTYTMTFRLYDVAIGGTALWSEAKSVIVGNGLFSTYLGQTTPLPLTQFDGRSLWLGIKVGVDPEVTPRVALSPAPYAISLIPGAQISGSIPGLVGILRVVNSSQGAAALTVLETGSTGSTYGLLANTFSPNGAAVYGYAESGGTGVAAYGYSGSALNAYAASSDGWAGVFSSAGNGVHIFTDIGKSGLIVENGSKSAAVNTSDGMRLLYSEEATQVWFADYGFGRLQAGRAVISIDPIFAQTVNLKESYHVFLQAYGDAEIYVSERTPTQFEVRAKDGDPDVEFSYRLVAKRLGYEPKRLEPAPPVVDNSKRYAEKLGLPASKLGATLEQQEPARSPEPH
jgi:hypothetical protein